MNEFFEINDNTYFYPQIINTTISFSTQKEKNITQNLYKNSSLRNSNICVNIRNTGIADIYEQLNLLYILGIKHIVFALNKADLYSFSESKIVLLNYENKY